MPTDTASVGLPGGTIAQGNYSELDLNSSVTIASLSLTSTGRIELGNLGGGMLTVTNPITLGPNQEIYTYQYQSPVLTAPITLTGGYLGYPIYPYGLVDTGNVTASSGTSTLNVVNITGTLTINSARPCRSATRITAIRRAQRRHGGFFGRHDGQHRRHAHQQRRGRR